MTKKNIIAIIPAREGSKGIINKNLQKIGKTTLLEKAINDCKKVKRIDEIVVSTDSSKIKKIAIKNKLKVPFLRTKKNSTSKASIIDALIETVIKSEHYYKKLYDIILLIETTSPLRTFKDINKSLNKYINSNFDFLWTVSKIDLDFHPLKQLKLNQNKIELFDKKGIYIKQRQQLKHTYRRNGVCYVINRDKLFRTRKLINNNTGFLLLNKNHISIDTKEDLYFARKFFKKNK